MVSYFNKEIPLFFNLSLIFNYACFQDVNILFLSTSMLHTVKFEVTVDPIDLINCVQVPWCK